MIGNKTEIREIICDSNKDTFDLFMNDLSEISMQDMIDYARATDSVSTKDVVLWLYKAVDKVNYDKSYYYEDLKQFINNKTTELNYPKSLNDMISECGKKDLLDTESDCCNGYIINFIEVFCNYLKDNDVDIKSDILDLIQNNMETK